MRDEKINFVKAILPDEILLQCRGGVSQKALKELGARKKLFSRYAWVIPYRDEDLPGILMTLRDLGFLFFGRIHGWPPASVFLHLRKTGQVKGHVKEVYWDHWGQLQIVDH